MRLGWSDGGSLLNLLRSLEVSGYRGSSSEHVSTKSSIGSIILPDVLSETRDHLLDAHLDRCLAPLSKSAASWWLALSLDPDRFTALFLIAALLDTPDSRYSGLDLNDKSRLLGLLRSRYWPQPRLHRAAVPHLQRLSADR
jgi:hypothetical protein